MARPVESFMTGPAIPTVVDHGLPLYFASDEALVDILDRYPHDLHAINHYSYDTGDRVARITGSSGRADGAALLKAIRAGQVWVNLRSCEEAHPGLWAEAMRSFGNLAGDLGAKGARNLTGRLIISSPATRAPYHFDAEGEVLFHLRGVKRVWVYPSTEAFLPQADMEKTIMRIASEDLAHHRIMDGAAYRFDIVPGQALTWPLYAPHREENQEGLCVTLSINYATRASQLTTGAHCANGVLRERGWTIKPMATTGWVNRAALWAASGVFTMLGLVKPNLIETDRIFDVPRTELMSEPTSLRERAAAA